MKKVLALVLALVVCLGVFAGCSSNKDTGTSTDTGSVYWLNFKPEADEAFQKLAKAYTEETGVPVTVVTAASGTYQQTLTSEMDKSTPPTLYVVTGSEEMKSWADYAYDLEGSKIAGELADDSFKLYTEDGKFGGIAYCYEAYGLIVNKNLLAEAGYSLEDVYDFASLKAVCEDIHARSAELGFDAFTSSGMDASSSWRFTGHLLGLPLYYEKEAQGYTSQPATLTGEYLDNFKMIWDLYLDNSAYDPATLATGGYDAEKEFLDGKAVFYQNGTWEYSALSAKYTNDELAMIPIYCGVEGEENSGVSSGTGNIWVVNSKAKQADIDATLEFMYWCVSSDVGTEIFAQELGGVPYKQAAESPNVFFQYADKYVAEGKYNVDWQMSTWTPNTDAFRAGIVSAMNKYDADRTDANWAEVVTAVTQGWANQYKAANP